MSSSLLATEPVLEHGLSHEPFSLGDETFDWPQTGSLEMIFQFPDFGSTLELASELRNDYLNAHLFDLPVMKGRFWAHYRDGLHTGAGLALLMSDQGGKEKRLQMDMSRLDGRKPYHLTVTWDLPQKDIRLYLQGVRQGDLSHWGADSPNVTDPGTGPSTFGGQVRHGGKTLSSVQVQHVRVYDEVLTSDQIQKKVEALHLPSLSGEGRTVYEGKLDIEGLNLKPVFATDFTGKLDWQHEEELLENDNRVRLPDADWVLEGPNATVTPMEKGIKLATSKPDDRKLGHIVLWLNKEMPADFLLEYSFTPENDRKGLGITFFNARNPDGETLFDLDLPVRRGMFREYIIGAIDSYHVSPWAADDKNLRRTANMRKNSGFMLVSVGNDLIGGSGPGPHTVRILKRGGHVQVESKGILVLEYKDDGTAHGPVYDQPGLIGLRFMAHGESAVVHHLKVWQVE
jgi:hypothetical protein